MAREILSNRQVRVQINGEQGRPISLRLELQQGSVLLLLFLLYINNLKTVVEVAMFADDVSLFCSHPCN